MTVDAIRQWFSARQFESRRWFGRRTWIFLGALILGYIKLLGDYGLYNLWDYQRRVEALRAEIAHLEQKRTDLLELKIRLQAQDPQYIEQIARERYGMVKPGESLYRVRDAETPQIDPR